MKNLLLQDVKFDSVIKSEENAFVSHNKNTKPKKFKCHDCKKEGILGKIAQMYSVKIIMITV